MKKTTKQAETDFDTDDLRPEYDIDYSKAKRNRFAKDSAVPRRLIILLDSDIPKNLTAADFKLYVAAKWAEFANDLMATMKQLGLETNRGLLLASVLIPLLQAYETEADQTKAALPHLLKGVSKNQLDQFTKRFLASTGSFWEVEKIVRDDPEMARVFDMLIERGDAMQAAQAALGAEWKHFAEQLREEQTHSA